MNLLLNEASLLTHSSKCRGWMSRNGSPGQPVHTAQAASGQTILWDVKEFVFLEERWGLIPGHY